MNYHSDQWIMDRVQEHYMEWINKYLYNPKQLHHLLRVEEYIERYINGVNPMRNAYSRKCQIFSSK